jgi:hypothetical protein
MANVGTGREDHRFARDRQRSNFSQPGSSRGAAWEIFSDVSMLDFHTCKFQLRGMSFRGNFPRKALRIEIFEKIFCS